jgi:hypothetical protein
MQPMTDAHRRYVNRETAVSVVINAVLSLLACWIVFGRQGLGAPDARAFAFDFLPQAFILSAMSTLLPGLVTRSRVRAGVVERLPGGVGFLPGNLLLRALVLATAALCLGGTAALLLTFVLWSGPLGMGAVYVIKLVFGVLLAVPVTRLALRAALADPLP